MARGLLLLLAAVGVAGVTGLAGAAPAFAHASVGSTSPSPGQELSRAPTSVSMTFDESVGVSASSLRVLDAKGDVVSVGEVYHPGGSGSSVAVALSPALAPSSYLVVWRVVSADSHPVSGTFTFGVGVPAGQVTAAAPSDPLVSATDAVARFAALVGTVVLVGATAFVLLVWRDAWGQPRLRRLLVRSWQVTVLASVAAFVLEGPFGSSLPITTVTDPSLLALTLGTLYGRLLLLRLLGLAGAAVLWRSLRTGTGPPAALDAVGLAVLVIESYSLAGHAGQGTWVPLAATADALHVAAACTWLGGLAVLLVVVRSPQSEGPAALVGVLPRWSRVAATAVGVLVVTGTYQAWREIGSLGALVGTGYGRLVAAKVLALALMMPLASYGRTWVIRHARVTAAALVPVPVGSGVGLLELPSPERPQPPSALVGLRRSVSAEAGMGLMVLALTAVLVDTMPARDSYSPTFSTTIAAADAEGDTLDVALTVSPTTYGPQTVTIAVTDAAGTPVRVTSATGSLTQTEQALGPIDFELTPAPGGATGRALAESVSVPAAGTWVLVLQVQVDQFTDYSATTSYRVS
jgi:copper transport protein